MNSVSPFLGSVSSAYILTLILLLTSIFLPFRLLCCFGKTFYFQKCQWKAVGAKGGTPLPHLSWGERPLIALGGHPTFRDALTQTQSRADPHARLSLPWAAPLPQPRQKPGAGLWESIPSRLPSGHSATVTPTLSPQTVLAGPQGRLELSQ